MAALGILWVLLVGIGICFVAEYENTPGAAAAPHIQFPAESQIKRLSGFPTLIMLVYPPCPCTRASMGELELLVAQTQGRVKPLCFFSIRRSLPLIGRKPIYGKPPPTCRALKSCRIRTEKMPNFLMLPLPVRLSYTMLTGVAFQRRNYECARAFGRQRRTQCHRRAFERRQCRANGNRGLWMPVV